ncbi:MAG: twin-arginine translocase TatA/TatE family subunit [Acidimicrobiia bacterium]|nr:twin-arginine translocase TatA/TatE family subunit [Acidimicrobiia bacterium]
MILGFGMRGPELLVILVIVLLLFGGSQLPKLAKSLGQAQREFKKSIDEDSDDDETTSSDDTSAKKTA